MQLNASFQLSATLAPALAYVVENFADEITLEDLAQVTGLSRFTFCRRFHLETGIPPMRWLWLFRALLAREMISLDPSWSLTDVAFACGYTSSAHFSRAFRAAFQTSPTAARRMALAANDAAPKAHVFGASYDSTQLAQRVIADSFARRLA